MDQVCALIEEARTINEHFQALCVLNAADPVGRDNDEAAAALRAYEGVRYLNCPVIRRKVFPNASAQDKSVLEYTPKDQKAVDEITNLMAFVYQKEPVEVSNGYRKEA